jgi:SPP1 family phage portal protein
MMMIKITKNIKDEYENGKIQDLFNEVDNVLSKRQEIQDRYLRGITSTSTVAGGSVQVFFEKFITDLAAGYLSGEIVYNAEIVDQAEEPAYRLLHPSNTAPLDPDTAAQLKFIITTLSSKNDDQRELKQLFHVAVLFGAAYERQLDLENTQAAANPDNPSPIASSSDPNYTYYSLSALNTVAVFSTDIADQSQQNAIGLISVYTLSARNSEDNQEHTLYYCVECNPYTTCYKTSIYDKTTSQDETGKYKTTVILKDEKESTHNISTISVFEPDPQVSIIDPIISLVTSYENIMNNLNNLYQYNDTDAKLKISGYRPENPLTIPNPTFDPEKPVSANNPEKILNPARELEDEYLINSKTFFVQEGGDVSWLLKEIHAEDATKYLKYYVDSIFQVSGIPNTSDAAFNSGDMNASAIDRKFYTMALMLDDIRQGITVLIKHRWANFFTRINLLSNTYYNVDDITITINTNLPSMTDENINQQLALNGILSQKTLLSNLGYDYATEKKNKAEEHEVPYDTMVPDTAYVSPNRVTSTGISENAGKQATSVNTGLTTGQTNNQIQARTSHIPSVEKAVPTRTDNVRNIQTREGRPNK